MTDRNAHILQLATWGYHLVPWSKRQPTTHTKPLIADWLKRKLSYVEVQAYAKLYPDADWAIVPQETVVLDLEHKHGLDGEADLSRLQADYGLSGHHAFTDCPRTRTKSGGLHLWFRQPDGGDLVGGCHIAPGVECKSRNGSVHIPPSVGYTEIVGLRKPVDLPPIPSALAELWRSSGRPRKASELPRERFGEGERRLMLCRVAGRLVQHLAMNEAELYASLVAVRDERCENPETFTDQEIRAIAHDFARKRTDSFTARADAGDPWCRAIQDIPLRRKLVRPDPSPEAVA